MNNSTTHIETEQHNSSLQTANENPNLSLRGTKQSQHLVPKLRFKEFDDLWNVELLGNIVSKVGSGSTPSGGVQVYQTSGIPFIRSQNVYDNKLVLDETHISEKIHEKMKGSSVQSNDILLNITGGSIGRSCVVPNEFDEGNVNQHVCIIRLKSNYTPKFLQPFLASHKGQKLIFQGQTGSGREGINFQSIRLFKLNLPSLPEQQKIASFLSAVDEKIQQLSKKKKLLEVYKKGVMQQLFSGKLRFKDENGKEYPEWEKSGLGKHIDLFSGYAFKGEDISENENGIPLLRGINITEGYIRHSLEMDRYFNKDIKDIEKLMVKEGDLVLSMDGSKVGKNSALITKFDEGALLVQRVARIRSLKTSTIEFIYQHIRSTQFIRYVDTVNTSSGIPHISSKQIKEFKINFPCLEEQQKIASFLSAIDSKIERVSHQINQTQSFKKGLLQQMFV
ncbi:restriction endonuclease subunit S [Marinifilum sp. RC60d5]|uniref:restriction endonuclease subunit S n=1 Tax=Marinifilum sp. RC60d5 TaxID=3458414 RepID=UPI004035544F